MTNLNFKQLDAFESEIKDYLKKGINKRAISQLIVQNQ